MENPTKIEKEEIVSLYCGVGFVNPDKKQYTYEVLQDIQNRFIEKNIMNLHPQSHSEAIESKLQGML